MQGGEGIFCLPKLPIKFKTHSGAIFMFRVDMHLHNTITNKIGDQYGIFFYKRVMF
jgi:hypothetical protein